MAPAPAGRSTSKRPATTSPARMAFIVRQLYRKQQSARRLRGRVTLEPMADESYEQSLVRDGRNLVALAKAGELPEVDFRDAEVQAIVEHLDRQRSVLVVGPSGAGKTSIIHGVARAFAARGTQAVYEFSTIGLLSGTRYIGEWQTKVTRIANAAASSRSILFLSDIWNLPRTGRTSSNDNNLLDALKPFLDNKRLRLLAEASPEVLRAMQRVPGFLRLFQVVDIAALAPAEVDQAIARAAARKDVTVDLPSRQALVKLTTRFLAARPQPGPALQLLDDVIDYREEKRRIGELEVVSPAFIERVFSITSGLPPFVVSRNVTMPAGDIRAWFEARIVGQRPGIDAVVESIALFKAGLHDPGKPIGTFLFVGPTGCSASTSPSSRTTAPSSSSWATRTSPTSPPACSTPCAPTPSRCSSSTSSRRPTRTSGTCSFPCSTRAASPRPAATRWTSATRSSSRPPTWARSTRRPSPSASARRRSRPRRASRSSRRRSSARSAPSS